MAFEIRPEVIQRYWPEIMEGIAEAEREFKEVDYVKAPEAIERQESALVRNYGARMCIYLLQALGPEEFMRQFGASSVREAMRKCVLGAMRLMDRAGGDQYKFNYMTGLLTRIREYAEERY